jgi:hypothetical protein
MTLTNEKRGIQKNMQYLGRQAMITCEIPYILKFHPKEYLEVPLNTDKVYLRYRKSAYVGSMSGMEFRVEESDLPDGL